jgi:hypothetical protein
MTSASPLWRFGQCFGEKDADEEFSEADVLSAIEFDTTGNYLVRATRRLCGRWPWWLGFQGAPFDPATHPVPLPSRPTDGLPASPRPRTQLLHVLWGKSNVPTL